VEAQQAGTLLAFPLRDGPPGEEWKEEEKGKDKYLLQAWLQLGILFFFLVFFFSGDDGGDENDEPWF
jgi:hypothetical protein